MNLKQLKNAQHENGDITLLPFRTGTLNKNHINVSVRLKPMHEQGGQGLENSGGNKGNNNSGKRLNGYGPVSAWHVVNEKTITDKSGRECHHFDKVFTDRDNTEYIFNQELQAMVKNALSGYNVMIAAFGQTAAGKTHTIVGTPDEPGIIMLAARELFQGINSLYNQRSCSQDISLDSNVSQEAGTTITAGNQKMTVRVWVQYLEIYNESINDLLDVGKRNLDIRENKNGDIIVDNLTSQQVNNEDQLRECLEHGAQVRMTAATKMNSQSSRSHTVFQLKVNVEDINTQTNRRTIKASVVNIVDLAGSEGAGKSQAKGLRQREGAQINKSLLALSNVIIKLSEQQSILRGRGAQAYHINFRDSKLTRILQTSLLGKSQAAIICCISQISANVQETIQTLYFGTKAKNIRTKAQMNEIIRESPEQIAQKMSKMATEIEDLNAQVSQREMQIKEYTKLDTAFKSVGPLKEQIEQMESTLQQRTEQVLKSQQDSQEWRDEAEQLQYKLGKARQDLIQSQEMGTSLDKMYQALTASLACEENSGRHKSEEIEGLRTLNKQLQEKLQEITKVRGSNSSQMLSDGSVALDSSQQDFLMAENSGMRLELQQLRTNEIESAQQNKNLQDEVAKYKQIAEEAEAKYRQAGIRRDAAKQELKLASTETEKYRRICEGLQEKVSMQGETNKNLFRELEASFIDYRKSGIQHQVASFQLEIGEEMTPGEQIRRSLDQMNLTEGQARAGIDQSANKSMVVDGMELQVRQLEQDRDDLLNEKGQLKALKDELAQKVRLLERDLVEYQDQLDKVAIDAKERDVKNSDRVAERDEELEELYSYIEGLEEEHEQIEKAYSEALATIEDLRNVRGRKRQIPDDESLEDEEEESKVQRSSKRQKISIHSEQFESPTGQDKENANAVNVFTASNKQPPALDSKNARAQGSAVFGFFNQAKDYVFGPKNDLGDQSPCFGGKK